MIDLSTEPFCCNQFKEARREWKIYLVKSGLENAYYEIVDSKMHTVFSDIQYCPYCGTKLEPKPQYDNTIHFD